MTARPVQSRRTRSTRIALAALGALWALAWLRLITTHLATPAPALDVAFTTPDGPVRTTDVYCHRAAWVDRDDIWQICDVRRNLDGESWLTRFDLPAGRGHLLTRLPPEGPHLMSAGALARHPAGGLVLLAGGRVLHLTPDGDLVPLGDLGHATAPCLAWDGDTLEVAGGGGTRAWLARRAPDGQWSRTDVPPPAPRPGTRTQLAGCERHPDRPDPWRFLWVRAPERADALPVPGTVLESGPATPATETQTLHLGDPDPDPFRPRRVGLTDGAVFLYDVTFDRAAAGGLDRGASTLPLERGPDGRWREPPLPAAARLLAKVDYIVGDTGLIRHLVFDHHPGFVRAGATWFTLTGRPYRRLAELGADLDPANPARGPGPLLVNDFWITTGLELLPAPAGGWWLRGSLGQSYLHVSDDLRRTDDLGFGPRLARALREDRAKRNSDFYLGAAAWLRPAAFLWVLFAPPLLLTLAFALTRGPRRDPTLRNAALLYVAITAAAATTFWKLSGVFW